MPEHLTNLLPEERRSVLRRNYFLRLGTTAAGLVIALVVIAAGLLVPTYEYLSRTSAAEHARLATVESSLASSDEALLASHLSALSADAKTLSALQTTPSVVQLIRSILAVPRPGVVLTAFTYAPATAKKPGTIVVTGTASTRDALRLYQVALQGTSFASKVDLPVSAYAQASNISFTVTITLAS